MTCEDEDVIGVGGDVGVDLELFVGRWCCCFLKKRQVRIVAAGVWGCLGAVWWGKGLAVCVCMCVCVLCTRVGLGLGLVWISSSPCCLACCVWVFGFLGGDLTRRIVGEGG